MCAATKRPEFEAEERRRPPAEEEVVESRPEKGLPPVSAVKATRAYVVVFMMMG